MDRRAVISTWPLDHRPFGKKVHGGLESQTNIGAMGSVCSLRNKPIKEKPAMLSMTRTFRVFVAAASLSAICLGAHPASARRSLAVGFSSLQNPQCFAFSYFPPNAGVALSSATGCSGFIPPGWVIPLHLDTSGTKTVALTVKQTQANQLTCGLVEFNASGSTLQTIAYNAFPVGGYSTSSKSITIASGNNLGVVCNWNTSIADITSARVLSVSY